jgi:hypothetical protein
MSTSTRFLKAQAGKQAQFGTAVTTTFQLPFTGEYEDLQEEHIAEYDSGTWTPTTIVEKVADYAKVSLSGVMFFEFLPVFFNMGHDLITVSDQTTYQQYDDAISPTAVGVPRAYTFLLGGGQNIGGTGPAVRIQDTFLESMTLAGNLNSKEITVQADAFGLSVNDNSGAGYAFAAVGLPANIGMMKTMLGALNYQDATSTGGDFQTMTALSCVMMDWSWTWNTGLVPKWASDGNALTYCGVRHNAPSVEFTPTIRTNSTTYAAIKGKANARTYQELQLIITGTEQRAFTLNMTGRWLPNFVAHSRANDEVVMTPTFRVETPHTQTTTPHWMSWELDTEWSH